jgi:hypothetical protein
MVRCRALTLALTVALLAGCSAEHSSSSRNLLKRFRPFQGVSGPDAVYLDVALVQIPRGDQARFRELWTFLDEGADREAVTLEKKSVLEENGFRVGRGGMHPPEELLELTEERHCPGARRVEMRAGKDDRAIDLGPALPQAAFRVVRGEDSTAVELKQAQFCLGVRPVLADKGRTRLQITPKVKHASKEEMPWRPRPDLSGWTFQVRQPVEEYEALGWEMTLDPGEYLIIGAREDRPGTLGHSAFVRNAETPPVQRLLILRVWRPGSEQGTLGPATVRGGKQAVPLALQAAWPRARGMMPE